MTASASFPKFLAIAVVADDPRAWLAFKLDGFVILKAGQARDLMAANTLPSLVVWRQWRHDVL
jgi:hypothetical protein